VSERDDTVGYEYDSRDVHGPVVHLYVEETMQFAPWFVTGFCPRCCSRLSWNRALCFPDEREDECAKCRVCWVQL